MDELYLIFVIACIPSPSTLPLVTSVHQHGSTSTTFETYGEDIVSLPSSNIL